jgi:hypothetical protein
MIQLGLLLQQIIGQFQAKFTQPPLIETNIYIRKNSKGITGLTTTINYMQTYSEYPGLRFNHHDELLHRRIDR